MSDKIKDNFITFYTDYKKDLISILLQNKILKYSEINYTFNFDNIKKIFDKLFTIDKNEFFRRFPVINNSLNKFQINKINSDDSRNLIIIDFINIKTDDILNDKKNNEFFNRIIDDDLFKKLIINNDKIINNELDFQKILPIKNSLKQFNIIELINTFKQNNSISDIEKFNNLLENIKENKWLHNIFKLLNNTKNPTTNTINYIKFFYIIQLFYNKKFEDIKNLIIELIKHIIQECDQSKFIFEEIPNEDYISHDVRTNKIVRIRRNGKSTAIKPTPPKLPTNIDFNKEYHYIYLQNQKDYILPIEFKNKNILLYLEKNVNFEYNPLSEPKFNNMKFYYNLYHIDINNNNIIKKYNITNFIDIINIIAYTVFYVKIDEIETYYNNININNITVNDKDIFIYEERYKNFINDLEKNSINSQNFKIFIKSNQKYNKRLNDEISFNVKTINSKYYNMLLAYILFLYLNTIIYKSNKNIFSYSKIDYKIKNINITILSYIFNIYMYDLFIKDYHNEDIIENHIYTDNTHENIYLTYYNFIYSFLNTLYKSYIKFYKNIYSNKDILTIINDYIKINMTIIDSSNPIYKDFILFNNLKDNQLNIMIPNEYYIKLNDIYNDIITKQQTLNFNNNLTINLLNEPTINNVIIKNFDEFKNYSAFDY